MDNSADDDVVSVNTYGYFAEIYDGFGSEEFCLSLTTHLLESLEKYRLPPGAEIVDLACGTGVITTELAKSGYQLVGLDLSEDMLRHAKHQRRTGKSRAPSYQTWTKAISSPAGAGLSSLIVFCVLVC